MNECLPRSCVVRYANVFPAEVRRKLVKIGSSMLSCRDNVGLLLAPLKEKIVEGKPKILLCNDIVDSVRICLYHLLERCWMRLLR